MSSCIEGTEMNKLFRPTEEMIEIFLDDWFKDETFKEPPEKRFRYAFKAMISKSETIPKLLAVVEALKFYADEKNYLTVHAENPAPNIVMDDGELARKTLKDLG